MTVSCAQRKEASGRDSVPQKGPPRTPQPAQPGEHDRVPSRPQDPALARRRSVPLHWRGVYLYRTRPSPAAGQSPALAGCVLYSQERKLMDGITFVSIYQSLDE